MMCPDRLALEIFAAEAHARGLRLRLWHALPRLSQAMPPCRLTCLACYEADRPRFLTCAPSWGGLLEIPPEWACEHLRALLVEEMSPAARAAQDAYASVRLEIPPGGRLDLPIPLPEVPRE